MRLNIDNIIDRHAGQKAYVCGHGPSLANDKERIVRDQASSAIRFSPNNWYDFFDVSPSYWILSNTNYDISKMFEIMNQAASTVIYSIDGDPTPYEFIDRNLKCDYLPYDQRHFKNHDCLEILKNFSLYHNKNKDFNFTEYGNNSAMWHPPRTGGQFGWAGFDPYSRCCSRKITPTVQEALQAYSGHPGWYSNGDTVLLHGLAFAILMGCNPIYISGLDLDYHKGYANKSMSINLDHLDMWRENSKNLINDLNILNESALMRGIKIVNLKKGAWYGVFEEESNS